jgi:GDP-mannose 6-dehydrogenase
MLGSNRAYLERQLPQIGEILRPNLADVLSQCQAVVVTQKRPEFLDALRPLAGRIAVLDLVGLSDRPLGRDAFTSSREMPWRRTPVHAG